MASRQATATRERPAQNAQAPQTGNLPANEQPKRVHPLVAFRDYAEERIATLQTSLPKHISQDVFLSVGMTALQKKPELLKCTKQSLWNAFIMAAQDGLLPDGREGAIAPYGQNVDGKRSAEIATWMPMIEGLRKKARNSGEILNWEVHAVRARDHFRFALGDDAFIEHEPYFGNEDPGDVLGVYSIATLKDGTKSRDVMTIRDVRKIEAKSSAKNGPWKDPTFFGEMAKKTIARRHYKQLPHSAALDKLIARDDAEFDLDHQADEQVEQRQTRRLASTTAAFDRFAGQTIDHDAEIGEVIDEDFGGNDAGQDDFANADDRAEVLTQEADQQAAKAAETQKRADAEKTAAAAKTAEAEKARQAEAAKTVTKKDDAISGGPQGAAQGSGAADKASAAPPAEEGTTSAGASDAQVDDGGTDRDDPGVDSQDRRWPNGATPSNEDEYEHYAETTLAYFTDGSNVAPWWKSKEQIDLRKACGVKQSTFDRILKKAQNRVAELKKSGK
jgi:recombination protein RecT